jgi:murein L,D-transpeptidase YafK
MVLHAGPKAILMRTLRFVALCMMMYPGFVVADPGLPVADKVLVKKAERKMLLIYNGKAYREYTIALGDNPIGHKQQQGDERTPEGTYIIDYRNPQSRYHLSLHITYPNEADRKQARKRGVNPGGDIFIHGLPNGWEKFAPFYKSTDWTDGCIAVSNEEIEEIWKLVKNGTPIEILP